MIVRSWKVWDNALGESTAKIIETVGDSASAVRLWAIKTDAEEEFYVSEAHRKGDPIIAAVVPYTFEIEHFIVRVATNYLVSKS